MHAFALALLARLLHAAPGDSTRGHDHASFITTLGSDTVAVESTTLTAVRCEGDIVIRVPGTVRLHYTVDATPGGDLVRSDVTIDPLGTQDVTARRVQLDVTRDSVRMTVDSSGQRHTTTAALPPGAHPMLRTGFNASYGLYESIGLDELALLHFPGQAGDTLTVPSIDVVSGRVGPRRWVRGASGAAVDFFGIGWTRLALDSAQHVVGADASETTEQIVTVRSAFGDALPMARVFAAADHSGQGLGAASPNATVASNGLFLTYGSPRRRGREILGHVVPYGRVWRTGANAATTLITTRDLLFGGTRVPAGVYSLWTIPQPDGVDLVVNRQHGQWGTHYDPAQDLAHIPMQTSTVATPAERFTIGVSSAGANSQLQIAWDTFQWSVPITRP